MKWKRSEKTGHLEANIEFTVRLTRKQLEALKEDMPEGTDAIIVSVTPAQQPECRAYTVSPIKKEN